ncbi:hypothetical protein BDP27DRAFT_1446969 [Rhodocollybia butyracea]|uniref:DUF6533 domain-containing protein n=1 Tax=Rhodocollybia butyracea TaxID=206335 RepID=A0A9P5PWB5_9AGAR|nr:hypothetical protein BDP27DRAFT_1446969 [Rhodocollybia butyracea]
MRFRFSFLARMADISEIDSVRLANMLFASALVILFYDHLLTLDSEIRLLWRRPRNAGGYLFFVNRYFALGNIVPAISLFSTSFSPSSCQSLELYHQVFQSITQGIVTALFALRVYALYGLKKTVLIIFMGIAILGAVTSISLSFVGRDESTPSDLGCHILLNSSNAASIAIGWEGLLIVDSILFAMTMRKAYQTHFSLSGIKVGRSLLSVIIRDGSIYFLIMALLNVVNIITLHISGPLQGNLSAFVGCLSVTLMSRMILNLHQVADTGIYTDHATITI